MAQATARQADLVVVGSPSAGVDALQVIAGLKRERASAGIPALHLLAPESSCAGCGAEVCLPVEAAPETLTGVARVLLSLRRSRQEREPASEAPAADRRSQRLEALGRLTGGIAHDFNNLLGVIAGQCQLTQRLLSPGHPAIGRLERVLEAADRATALTRQLLAFSREPGGRRDLLDLNATVAKMGEMLRGVVGKDVALEIRAAPHLGAIRVDTSQIEQVVLNLAVNARDAMPGGGRLTIETADEDGREGAAPPGAPRPGRWVVLAVSDDGVGMDAETPKRIFEPFFTTKPEGQGSGLGLAIVHAIVEQGGGFIDVDSEPGRGTTFRIHWPRADGDIVGPDPLASAPDAPEGSETVLLVEDAANVREVTRALLETLGYTVLSASRADEALALARNHRGPIELLLTDVIMPDQGGGRLAEQIAASRPETRVLFMSGYGASVLSLHGDLGEGAKVLPKPFGRDELARAVREALDGNGR